MVYSKKQKDGLWKLFNCDGYTISESSIGEGKRFQIVKEEVNLNNLLKTKDYEVLDFKIPGNEHWEVTKIGNGTWNNWSDLHVKNQLEKNIWKIKRVKRLSDGEIFQIGDRIDNKEQLCKNSKIESFAFDTKNNILVWVHNDKPEFKVGLTIDSITKSKPILFTTEDGVDIFEGDEFYYVKFIQVNHTIGKPFEVVIGNYPSFEYEPQYEKYFSKKEKAEEYIIMNKPCLSYNDLKYCIEKSNRNKTLLKTVLLNKIKEKIIKYE